jgi:hypothetical protein
MELIQPNTPVASATPAAAAAGGSNLRRSTVFNGLHEKLWRWYHPAIRSAYPWVLKRHAIDKTLLRFLKLVTAAAATNDANTANDTGDTNTGEKTGDNQVGFCANGVGAVHAAMHRYELARSDALQRLVASAERAWRVEERAALEAPEVAGREASEAAPMDECTMEEDVNVAMPEVVSVKESQLVSTVFYGTTYAQCIGSDYLTTPM